MKAQPAVVVNSNDDSVSVIDTSTDKEIRRINIRLAEARHSAHPESLALNGNTATSPMLTAIQSQWSLSKRGEGCRKTARGAERTQRSAHSFQPATIHPRIQIGRTYLSAMEGTGVENSSSLSMGLVAHRMRPMIVFPWAAGAAAAEWAVQPFGGRGNVSAVPEPTIRWQLHSTGNAQQWINTTKNQTLFRPVADRAFRDQRESNLRSGFGDGKSGVTRAPMAMAAGDGAGDAAESGRSGSGRLTQSPAGAEVRLV